MKSSGGNRILLLAAAASIPPQELEELIDLFKLSEPEAILSEYRRIRNRLRNTSFGMSLDGDDEPASKTVPIERRVARDIVLMVKRAKLSPLDATFRLKQELYETRLLNVPEYTPKEGLSRWLERTARKVGSKELLNAATVAFSKADNGDRGSWKLSNS